MTTSIIDTIHSHTIQRTNNSRFLGSSSRDGLSLLISRMTTIIYAISHVKVVRTSTILQFLKTTICIVVLVWLFL